MSSYVYSTRFIGEAVAAGSHATYTVPAGYVAVVVQILMLPTASGLTGASLESSAGWFLFSVTSGTLYVMQSSSIRAVLNAGETITTNSAGAAATWYVGGYLLALS
jgi:hypothetical protein